MTSHTGLLAVEVRILGACCYNYSCAVGHHDGRPQHDGLPAPHHAGPPPRGRDSTMVRCKAVSQCMPTHTLSFSYAGFASRFFRQASSEPWSVITGRTCTPFYRHTRLRAHTQVVVIIGQLVPQLVAVPCPILFFSLPGSYYILKIGLLFHTIGITYIAFLLTRASVVGHAAENVYVWVWKDGIRVC